MPTDILSWYGYTRNQISLPNCHMGLLERSGCFRLVNIIKEKYVDRSYQFGNHGTAKLERKNLISFAKLERKRTIKEKRLGKSCITRPKGVILSNLVWIEAIMIRTLACHPWISCRNWFATHVSYGQHHIYGYPFNLAVVRHIFLPF